MPEPTIKPEVAVRLIAMGSTEEMLKEAQRLGVDPNMVKLYRGYKPEWKATAEARGALVYIQRFIAGKAYENFLSGLSDELHRARERAVQERPTVDESRADPAAER